MEEIFERRSIIKDENFVGCKIIGKEDQETWNVEFVRNGVTRFATVPGIVDTV